MAEIVNVVIPTIGESISEGIVGRWFHTEGALVTKDEPLLEIDSDKASLEIPATATGRLKILVPEGTTAAVGTLIATIDTSAEGTTAAPKASAPAPQAPAPETKQAEPAPQPNVETPKVQVSESELQNLSPSQRRAARHGTYKPPVAQQTPGLFGSTGQNEIRKPMTNLRKRIAERLIESQQTTATLTTFNEVDMGNVMELRKKYKEEFQSKYGVKLGFMSFFSKAIIEAFSDYPNVNARIDGGDIVYPQYVNLGIAVSTERGLVVPVLKHAQDMSYAEIEKRIIDLADRARAGKLQIPEMQGGTFTITNGGIFGSLISTPIINPPQSAILGMHKIEQRPMAIQKEKGKFDLEVRPMMYTALSYDHRLIDGATSVGFLVKVKEVLETVTKEQVFS